MSATRLDYLCKVDKELKEAERLENVNPVQYRHELRRLLSSVERYRKSMDRTDQEPDGARNRAMYQAVMLKASALSLSIQNTLSDLQEKSDNSADIVNWFLNFARGHVYIVAAITVCLIICLLILS